MTGSVRVESELNNLQQIEVLGKPFEILPGLFFDLTRPANDTNETVDGIKRSTCNLWSVDQRWNPHKTDGDGPDLGSDWVLLLSLFFFCCFTNQ